MILSSYPTEIFKRYYHWQTWYRTVQVKGQCQRSKVEATEVMIPLIRFRTVTPVWIHIWRWNDAQSLTLLGRGALLYFKVICQISRPHWTKNRRFPSELGVSGCTKLEVAQERCPIVFQCYSSNVKVTRDKKLPTLTRIERFRTVTPVWIRPWLCNDAQSLM